MFYKFSNFYSINLKSLACSDVAESFRERRYRDVKSQRESTVWQIMFQQSWGSHPALLPVCPNSHSDAQKQKLHRKNIHGKVITQA